MKKTIFAAAAALLMGGTAFSQPVSDRAVIPVAVTLNQILRIHVTNGGNIEFVFNTIDDYKLGIPNSAFYDSNVVLASSTEWQLDMGAEDATLIGTDNPVNTLLLNNIGFTSVWTGLNTCCTALLDVNIACAGCDYTNANVTANGLLAYTGAGTAMLYSTGAASNGGDILDNAFTINWECGTQIAGGTVPMNATSLLTQSPEPDRYVTNVFLEATAI